MKRTIAKMLCFLICASVLFAVGSAIYGHLHHCVGEECQFCQVNSNLQKLYRIILLGCVFSSFAIIVLTLFSNANLIFNIKKQSVNLVFNKVKLSF
ncbi:MAG: hypothetical protein IKT35_02690 [Clostridia bacterium]|nr:hypothetical protein [Clostridia bacterium]